MDGDFAGDLDAWLKYEVREAVRSKTQAGYSNSASPRYSRYIASIPLLLLGLAAVIINDM